MYIQEASAEVLALKVQMEAMERLGVKTHVSDTEPMTAVLFRQARMQVCMCVCMFTCNPCVCVCVSFRVCEILRRLFNCTSV